MTTLITAAKETIKHPATNISRRICEFVLYVFEALRDLTYFPPSLPR